MVSEITMSDQKYLDACNKIESSYKRLDNTTIRKVYAYFKQATEGDVSGKRPGILRVRARIKFNSWSSISGISREDAKKAYIELANNLKLENEEISCDTRESQL